MRWGGILDVTCVPVCLNVHVLLLSLKQGSTEHASALPFSRAYCIFAFPSGPDSESIVSQQKITIIPPR